MTTIKQAIRLSAIRLKNIINKIRYHGDPTLYPPIGYKKARANAVYGEAFWKCFEYLTGTGPTGCVLEFGTYRGYTARMIAKFMKEFKLQTCLYLYDSFEGLPDVDSNVDKQSYEVSDKRVWFKGQMALSMGTDELIRRSLCKIIPQSSLRVIKGFFEDTLDEHLPATKAALVHIDCDLYSSTKIVLEKLLEKELFQDGTLLLFDDYNCNRANPNMGERRALCDIFNKQSRFTYTPFFSYGWHGQAFFIHDKKTT
jgi:hypothetical protein